MPRAARHLLPTKLSAVRPTPFLDRCPQGSGAYYRLPYRILTIGFSYKLIVAFGRLLLQTDRAFSYKLIVDNLFHP
jgi:hypothetical protein